MKQKDAALKRMLTGEIGFESYYSSLFDSRWPALRESLRHDPLYVKIDFSCGENSCQPYFIDAASVCAALCLKLQSGGRVLDLCAAPGGKSLVLAGELPDGAFLNSNELSPSRKSRLDGVLTTSLPIQLQKRICTSCSDGATWCKKESAVFSSILLDAPCSSERHVLGDSKYLAQWSLSRIRTLVARQWALLSSAFRLLQNGGCLLYATCALSPDENDGVLSRLIRKFPEACLIGRNVMAAYFEENLASFSGSMHSAEGVMAEALLKKTFLNAEETKLGLQVLPDKAMGAGPLFFALIGKANVM